MELLEQLEKEGYSHLREVPGKGLCGVMRFLFTTAIVYNIDRVGYEGRYCFLNKADAVATLEAWDGSSEPPGNWIKHKGVIGEFSNPKYI